jgi:hypothetical protein
MNPSETSPSAAGEPTAYERCPCREIADTLRDFLGISPAVRQHLTGARVEFLKAMREMLNEKIEHLSSQGQKGTRVAVE